MRIKSYFAPSVQTAIALARKEFGDGVTLVTSHVTSLDNRHLGEYEVVFAIEEPIEVPEEKAEPPAPAFHEMLQQALVAPAAIHQDVSDKLEQVHTTLVALGIESSLVRALMTMLKALVPAAPAAFTEAPAVIVPADLPAPEVPPAPSGLQSRYSAAELAFMSSVSSPKEQGARS
jgi:hypothetical protein